jgi:phytol kinase
LCFYSALEWTKRKTNISSDITRKTAHIVSAVLVIFFYFFLSRHEFILATSIFTVLFILSYLTNFLKSVHLEKRKTIGEILYPIALVILGLFFYEDKFVMIGSVAVMGFADGISGLYNLKHGKNSLKGSVVFFLVTAATILASYAIFYDQLIALALVKIILVSMAVSIIEHYSYFGTDNLTVPVSTALLLSFFL